MIQYTYAELLAEVEKRRKERSDILGLCCNCGIEVKKSEPHQYHYETDSPCCKSCDLYTDEIMIFCSLLACFKGTKSWSIFQKLRKE